MYDLDEHVDRFAHEVLADALRAAEGRHWRRRAATYEAAKPRAGDYTGQATPEQINAQRDRLEAKAQACRDRAKNPTHYELTEAP